MFAETVRNYVTGGAIALASCGILPLNEGHAQTSDVSQTGRSLNDAKMPAVEVLGQPSGFLKGCTLSASSSNVPQSKVGDSLPVLCSMAGAVLAGLLAAGALRRSGGMFSEELSGRHLICAALGGAVSYAAALNFATYDTIEGVTQVSRIVSTSGPYGGSKIGGKYYHQEFFIPEISTLPLICEVKEPLREGASLSIKFYVNDSKEIVGFLIP